MNMMRTGPVVSAILLTASLMVGGNGIAQDATPAAGPSMVGTYPVAIHQGTCKDPAPPPAYQLDNTAPFGADQPDAGLLGSPTGNPVLLVSSTIDATLSDVANGGNVVAVHASPEAFGTIVACGQIAGPDIDGGLVIALQPVGESTVTGVVTLSPDTSGVLGLGGDQIRVTAYVIEVGSNSPAEPTVATPNAPGNQREPGTTPSATPVP
ncbi:MAG TPA: hypothetical protein VGT61_12270 [Thermomicrobiales bacterium]|nr:hypothetical protein [Thermomicrobiales bacterium]